MNDLRFEEIDRLVVERAQVQPVRYAIHVSYDELSPKEQLKLVQRWRDAFRRISQQAPA